MLIACLNPSQYVGRFAPSPTGPLHFGSLVAAVASYLDAKKNKGKWLVRMENLDKPREVTGAADAILHTLEAFGFEWNDTVIYQSQRTDLYQAAFNQLNNQHLTYPCTCTRKEIADSSASLGIDGVIYPRTCLTHPLKHNTAEAWRIKTDDKKISFMDAIQGLNQQNIKQDVGDFILKRVDGLFAYQLAVVVDDAAQDITHIVRGADLLDSTPRQIYLQQQLGLSTPHYAHIPIATNSQGEKLSKQSLAPALVNNTATSQLWQALYFLNQNPPVELQRSNLNLMWDWAQLYWSMDKVPHQRTITT